MASVFHGPVDAGVAIPAPHCGPGGTMNFNFGSSQTDGQKRKPAPFSTVPFAPDPDFVDRPEILAWVRDKCAGPGARAALVGLGGVGKSQLAIQYAHGIRDATPQTFVLWVHASTPARFEEAYRDIADRLELPGRSEPKANVLRLVSDWLRDETNGQWVMVVDNVDKVETFFPARKRQRDDAEASPPMPLHTYLPQSRNGAILVTARSKDAAGRLVGGYNRIREVLAMDDSQGLQLLQNKLRDPPTQENARDLLHALDCIPLAITQSAAYINRRARMTIARYLDEFRRSEKRRESLLDWDADELRRDDSASNSVVTTWQISFEQIRQERPSAADLLSLMSFFNPQGIPESALRAYSKAAASRDNGNADDAFNEDLDTLQAYSLVSITADNDTCDMHALVQFCMRVWLSSCKTADDWQHKFVELMAKRLPSGEYNNWRKCQELFSHVEPLFEIKPAAEETLKAWARVLTNAAWYLSRRGSYSTAQKIAAKALAAREGVLGLEHPQTKTTRNILSVILWDQGMYKDAEKLNRQALAGWDNALEKDHPHALRDLSNLASVLRSQGRYVEAEKLHREVLDRRKNKLGEHHVDTQTSKINLAYVLQCQDKYAEAEELDRQALEGWQKKRGMRHPDTLICMSNLAVVLRMQGKHKEAESLTRQTLEVRELELGMCHPDTLTSRDNLAGVLHDLGRFEEAEDSNRQALEGRKQALGLRNPKTLLSMNNLAVVLRKQGKYDEAEKLSRQALAGRDQELGGQHLDTLVSVYCLANLLHHLRRYSEAAELYQRAYDGRCDRLGAEHPLTITCRNRLLAVQRAAGTAHVAE